MTLAFLLYRCLPRLVKNARFFHTDFPSLPGRAWMALVPFCCMEQRMVTECSYCHADIPVDEAQELPALDNNAAWARLEMLHALGCEWIATRGLQIT